MKPGRPLSPTTAKLPKARVIDIATTLDVEPIVTTSGLVLWANVEILYTSADSLSPRVSIRVPLRYAETESEAQRHDLALRAARQLIDHACGSLGPAEAPTGESLEMTNDTVLEGLTQELGLTEPRTKPARKTGR